MGLDLVGLRSIEQGPMKETNVNGELDLNEFEALMKGPMLQPFLPGGDWRDRVGQVRQALEHSHYNEII